MDKTQLYKNRLKIVQELDIIQHKINDLQELFEDFLPELLQKHKNLCSLIAGIIYEIQLPRKCVCGSMAFEEKRICSLWSNAIVHEPEKVYEIQYICVNCGARLI